MLLGPSKVVLSQGLYEAFAVKLQGYIRGDFFPQTADEPYGSEIA